MTTNEKKKSPKEWGEIVAKYNRTDSSMVNQAYIESFLKDAENYFNTATTDYDNITWGTAGTSYNTRNQAWTDLSSRADAIGAYWYKNRNNYTADAYKQYQDYLDSFYSGGQGIVDSFKNYSDYYKQWATQEDYDLWKADEDEYARVRALPEFSKYTNSGNQNAFEIQQGLDILRGQGGLAGTNAITDRNVNIDRIKKYLDPEDLAIYYYYLENEPEKAEAYYNKISNQATYESAKAKSQNYNQTGLELFNSLVAGVDSFSAGLKNVGNAVNGILWGTEAEEIQPTVSQYAFDMMRQDNEYLWAVANDLAQTIGNQLPSMALNAVIPGAGLVTMGTSAAGNAYSDFKALGYGEAQSVAYGVTIGALEAMLQKWVGGISGLGSDGGFASSAVQKVLPQITNGLARASLKLGANMLDEGLEEFAQGVLEPIVQQLVSLGMTPDGEKRALEIDWGEAVYSGLLGALSAGVLEGGTDTINTLQLNSQYNKAYSNNPQALKALLESIAMENPDLDISKVQNRVDAGKNVSGNMIRELAYQNELANWNKDYNKVVSATESRLNELGEQGNVKKLAESIARAQFGDFGSAIENAENVVRATKDANADTLAYAMADYRGDVKDLSRTDKRNIRESEYGRRVSNELNPDMRGETSSAWAEDIKINRLGKGAEGVAKTQATLKALKDSTTAPTVVPNAINYKSGAITPTLKEKGVQAKEKDLEGIANNRGYKGTTHEAFVKGYKGENLEEYQLGFDEAYRMGRTMVRSEELQNAVFKSYINEEAQMSAYNSGYTEAKYESIKKAEGRVKTEKTKGGFTVTVPLSNEALTESRKTAIEFFKVVAEVANANIKVVEDAKNHGLYDPKTNTISIDVNLGGKDFMVFSLSHELTHRIREALPEQFDDFAKMLFEAVGEKMSITERIKLWEKNNKQYYPKLTPAQLNDLAYEEVVCEMCESFLTDEVVARKLSEKMQSENKTLWEKIKDFFTDLINRLKEAYKNLDPQSENGRIVRDMGDRLDAVKQVWADMVVEVGNVTTEATQEQIKNSKKNTTLITAEMSDTERYEILKDKKIAAPIYNGEAKTLIEQELGNKVKSEAKKAIIKIAGKLGLIDTEINFDDINVKVMLSKSNLKESFSKDATPEQIAKLLPLINPVAENSIVIERHNNRYFYDTDTIYFDNLLGAYIDNKELVPVRLGLKHSKRGKTTLYIVVDQNKIALENLGERKNDRDHKDASPEIMGKGSLLSSVKYSISEIVRFVNTKDLLRYIPDQMLTKKQYSSKWEAIADTIKRTNEKNDSKYTEYIRKGDVISAAQMVKAAAKANGYSNQLYHGTATGFGFTVFDASKVDDKLSFFATSDERVAKTYSGETNRRNISDRVTIDVDSASPLELLGLMQKYIDENYRRLSKEEIEDLKKPLYETIRNASNSGREFIAENSGAFNESKRRIAYSIVNSISAMADAETDSEMDSARARYQDAVWELRAMDSSVSYEMLDVIDTKKLFSAVDDIELYTVSEAIFTNGIKTINENSAWTILSSTLYQGVYSLYGSEEGMLQIDANGSNWNRISTTPLQDLKHYITVADGYDSNNVPKMLSFKEAYKTAESMVKEKYGENAGIHTQETTDIDKKGQSISNVDFRVVTDEGIGEKILILKQGVTHYTNTRGIARYAKDAGYKGVKISNLKDSGGAVQYNAPSDVYIFFDSRQMKSADTITYDDDNNIIPLSQRFNAENDDIRYSRKTDDLLDKITLEDLLEWDDMELYGGDTTIEDISEELNTTPEKIEIFFKREGLGNSYIEDGRKAVMTQARIDEAIEYNGASNPRYAKRLITRISPEDFIDLTVLRENQNRNIFDSKVEGDSGSTMGTYDYKNALKSSRSNPYLVIDVATGRVIGHNGRHRMRAMELLGIKSVEIEVELYDDGIVKYHDGIIKDLVISSQFDTKTETHISNIIPLNESYRADIEALYGENANPDAQVKYSRKIPDPYTSRELLAKALTKVAKGDEKVLLEQYKSNLRMIEGEMGNLKNLRKEIDAIKYKKSIAYKGENLSVKEFEQRAYTQAETMGVNAEDVKFKVYKDTGKYAAMADGKVILEADKAFRSKEEADHINTLEHNYQATLVRISKYDASLLRIEAMQPMKQLLTREKAKAYKEAEAKGKEALKEYKAQAIEQQKAITQRYQEMRHKNVEQRATTEMRHKLMNTVHTLDQLLVNPTKKKHIPIGLQKPVAEALNILNMDTVGAEERLAKITAELKVTDDPYEMEMLLERYNRIKAQGDKIKEKIDSLKSAYAEILNSEDDIIRNSYDEVIANTIEQVASKVGDTPVRDMTYDQLESLYKMYRMILKTVRDANKSFTMAKGEEISTLGQDVMSEVAYYERKDKVVLPVLEKGLQFDWNNLKPVYAFERIGSSTLTELYNNVRHGEDVWAVDMQDARAYSDVQKAKYGYKSWDMEKTYTFHTPLGKEFKLNLGQIMSIYAYTRRGEQAIEHLINGGFVYDGVTIVEKKIGDKIKVDAELKDSTAYRLDEAVIGQINATLTKEQREFAEAMQKYLSETMGEKGNEVSLALYDIKIFGEKNYFPLKSSQVFLERAREQARGEVKIKNKGFTKETTPRANNPITLTSFMDVWADHCIEMSMYHAFTLPLEDFYRVYNYKERATDEKDTESVIMNLENAYGKSVTSYIDQLLVDLNGGLRTDPRAGILGGTIAAFKKASTMASLSVVVQQPSSIIRAMSMVDAKYFIDKPSKYTHKETWEEVKKYAPVAVIKEMGYFDVGLGKTSQEWLKNDPTKYEEFEEKWLTRAPALADEMGWNILWKAIKRETVAKHPELKFNSEEFLNECGRRFTEVVSMTQVYDSVFSRSANMRSKDTGMKMATSFMAEPTTIANMLEDAILKAKRGNKKVLGKTIGAIVFSSLVNAIAVSFVYAWRDDDDEEYWNKYLKKFVDNFGSNLNPLNMVPLARDFMSLIEGYDIERADMGLLSALVKAVRRLSSNKAEAIDKIVGLAGAISDLFGIPIKNIYRDFVRPVWRLFTI